MKKLMISLIVAGLMFAIVPQAQAINKEWSAALGFLGGVLVADSYHNHHHEYRQRVVYVQPCYNEPVYYYECAPGQWIRELRQRWISGYYIEGRDHYGYPYTKEWVEGHMEYYYVSVYRPCPRCGR